MKRLLAALFCFGLLFALSSSHADAGGWAVITLDALPREVVAGQAFTVGFTVRQHGRTLLDGLSPDVQALRSAPYDAVVAKARNTGGKGHYVADVKLPSAGAWRWEIEAFGAPQPMPTLMVSANPHVADQPASNPAPAIIAEAKALGWPLLWLWSIGGVSMFGAVVLFVLATRAQRRVMLGLSVCAALVGIGSLAFATWSSVPLAAPTAATQASNKPTALDETNASLAYGKDLFLAKGCVTCHAHDAFKAEQKFVVSELDSVQVPNLTQPIYTAEYLRRWLKEPTSVKPNTPMPNLGLKQDEINALAVFLTAGKESVSAPTAAPASVRNTTTSCPITKPQTPLFVPPAPYAAKSPWDKQFWYGSEKLWTAVRDDGTWRSLPKHESGYTQKVFWWRKDYNWQAEPTPNLKVTGKRLDGDAPPLVASRATSAYNAADIGSAMLVGVDFPTLGCWEITGDYEGNKLSFVVNVAP